MAISKIKTGSIEDGTISTADIANNAITTAKIDSGFTTSITTNPEFSGTEAAKMPNGTTGQRANAQAGDLRFNTTISLMEYYDGAVWKAIDSPPVIISITPSTELQSDDPQSVVILGSSFNGSTVTVVGTSGTVYTPDTTTVNSSSQITITFAGANRLDGIQEPYDVRVTNSSGLTAIIENTLYINRAPTWTTAAGSLGQVNDGQSGSFTIAGTEPEGESVTYSVVSGSLPTGLSLNTSTGAITGTNTAGSGTYNSSGVTYSITAGISDGAQTINRTFSILKKWYDGSTEALAAPSGTYIHDLTGTTTNGTFWIKPTLYGGSAIQCFVWNENSSFGRGAVLAGAFTTHTGFTMTGNTSGLNVSSLVNYHTTFPATGQTALLPKTFINALYRDSTTNHIIGGITGNVNGNGYGAIFQFRPLSVAAKGTQAADVDMYRYVYATGLANNNVEMRINTDRASNIGWTTNSFHNTRSCNFTGWATWTNGRAGTDGSDTYHYMPDDLGVGGQWMFRENSDDTPRTSYSASALSNFYVW